MTDNSGTATGPWKRLGLLLRGESRTETAPKRCPGPRTTPSQPWRMTRESYPGQPCRAFPTGRLPLFRPTRASTSFSIRGCDALGLGGPTGTQPEKCTKGFASRHTETSWDALHDNLNRSQNNEKTRKSVNRFCGITAHRNCRRSLHLGNLRRIREMHLVICFERGNHTEFFKQNYQRIDTHNRKTKCILS